MATSIIKEEPMEVDESTDMLPVESIPVEPLTTHQIAQIAMETIGQSNNPKWFAYRRNRITGSMFGKVIAAMNHPTARAIQDIKQTMNGDVNLSYLDPIKWGKENEQRAIAAYCQLTGRTVKPTGIWLFPSGQLGASPDGLVFESATAEQPSGILELKFPFYVRNLHYQEMIMQHRLPRYLTPSLQLCASHDYFHQVQGELFATRAPWCDFVMWTTRSALITRVFPSPLWASHNIPKLIRFYNDQMKNH